MFIDRPDDPVGLGDCERMNERLSELCDLEDPVPGAWTLEVSTPGLDRPLFSLEQCRRFLGRRVRVRHRAPDPMPDRKDPDREERRRPTVVGTIRSAESGTLGLEGPEGPMLIEWALVERVRLVPDFDALLGRAPAGKPVGKPAGRSAGKPGKRPARKPPRTRTKNAAASRSAGSGTTGGGRPAGNRRSARATGAAAGRRSPA